MAWKETLAQIRRELRMTLDEHPGSIARLEKTIDHSTGFLSKLCNGSRRIFLDDLLRTLDAAGVEAGGFFYRALSYRAEPPDHLAEIERRGQVDAGFPTLERAALKLAARGQVDEAEDGGDDDGKAATWVIEFADLTIERQQKRLRYSHRYRTPAFATAYLESLESLRYSDPGAAARLVRTVAIYLVPAIGGSWRRRLILECRALGIYATAYRLRGDFATAARALRLALRLAREHRLRDETARLLQRGVYLLKDHGWFERALGWLNEALTIYVETGSSLGVGKTLVERGWMYCFLGDHATAESSFERALEHFNNRSAEVSRNLVSAYQGLAYACEQSGELDAAEAWLAQATGVSGVEPGAAWAKLKWLHGTLAFKRCSYPRAEALLTAARKVLATIENPLQEAVVCLDLLRALLAQGKAAEADRLAEEMVIFLIPFEDNPLAEAAMLDVVRASLDGKLSDKVVRKAQAQLERRRTPCQGVPPLLY